MADYEFRVFGDNNKKERNIANVIFKIYVTVLLSLMFISAIIVFSKLENKTKSIDFNKFSEIADNFKIIADNIAYIGNLAQQIDYTSQILPKINSISENINNMTIALNNIQSKFPY